MNICEKLLSIQAEISVPKGHYNEFGGFYYRSGDDILSAVKPLCQKYKCVVVLSDNVELIGDRYYLHSTATLIDVEKPADVVTVNSRAKDVGSKTKMDDAQVTGAASSYARKYALNGLFALDDGNDPDGDDNTGNIPPKNQAVEPLEPIEGVKVNKMDAEMIGTALKRYPDDVFVKSLAKGIKLYGSLTPNQKKVLQSKLDQPYNP